MVAIRFTSPELPHEGVVVVGVLEERVPSTTARLLDVELGSVLGRAMQASRFRGKKEQTLSLLAPGQGGFDRVLLLGLGKAENLDLLRLQALGAQVTAALAGNGDSTARVIVDAVEGCALAPAEMAAEMAFGALLRAYRFGKYQTRQGEDERSTLKEIVFGCTEPARAEHLFERHKAVAEAVWFTRDLVSEPANVIYPQTLAAQARTLVELGVIVETLGEDEMQALGMGALLGVGQGSERESQLVVMQWRGRSTEWTERLVTGPAPLAAAAAGEAGASELASDKADKLEDSDVDPEGPLAFIGKGVTFDTGGISIKPAANMEDMKWDMAGAATVIGLMKALALRKAPVDVVGVVGLVENMPSGTAQRPGDVVRSLSGQTIEVINTDAEGRLVLADALTYTRKRFRPRFLIDLATLTGAIIIALGHEKAGLFSNDDALAEQLARAATGSGEAVWRLPLGEEYDKEIKSEIADMKNVGNRGAGSITAAQFLQRFVGKTPWAHLDIAGVAWAKKDREVTPKGASAFGIRLLDRLIADFYEAR